MKNFESIGETSSVEDQGAKSLKDLDMTAAEQLAAEEQVFEEDSVTTHTTRLGDGQTVTDRD